MEKTNFSDQKIKENYKKLKKTDFFYNTSSQKAVEYLWYVNDNLQDIESDQSFIGFFRSSSHQDCITFSVVNTLKGEINHCRYRILEDGSIVNLLNLRHEKEKAQKYTNIDQFVKKRSINMKFLNKKDIRKLRSKMSKS